MGKEASEENIKETIVTEEKEKQEDAGGENQNEEKWLKRRKVKRKSR